MGAHTCLDARLQVLIVSSWPLGGLALAPGNVRFEWEEQVSNVAVGWDRSKPNSAEHHLSASRGQADESQFGSEPAEENTPAR